MKIRQIPFNIDYPIKVFSEKKLNFGNTFEREKILRRNIYYYNYAKIKNKILNERSNLYLNLAENLKKLLMKRYKPLKILNISVFGSSLYSRNNGDFDFLVIVGGNKFSYLKTKLCASDGREYNIGVSIKGIKNFTEGLFDENSKTSLNLQSQIIYRTSISLFRRHIPLLGFDFNNNRNLFLKNGYSQVSDLLKNTYSLYYLKNSSRKLNEFERAQKILSRMFEAVAYLNLLSRDKRVVPLRKKILQNKSRKIRLNSSKEIFKEVLDIYENNIQKKFSSKKRKKEVLSVLSDEKIKKNIRNRLENYWKISGLPYKWINEIIEILHKYSHNEDLAIEEVRKRFPSIKNENGGSYFPKLKRFRKEKVKNLSKRISSHLLGEVIVDIGGRGDDFAEQILSLKKNIKKIYVTDLCSFTGRSNNSKIDFVVQPSSTDIPLRKNFTKTAILSMVLHHMDNTAQKKMVKSIKKILKKKGRLILIEDTFPKYPKSQIFDPNVKEFLSFKNSEKKKILYFYDWFGNRLMRGRDNIALYQNYKSMEEWTSFFKTNGMRLKSSEFIKENKKNPDLFPPKAIMVFENLEG